MDNSLSKIHVITVIHAWILQSLSCHLQFVLSLKRTSFQVEIYNVSALLQGFHFRKGRILVCIFYNVTVIIISKILTTLVDLFWQILESHSFPLITKAFFLSKATVHVYNHHFFKFLFLIPFFQSLKPVGHISPSMLPIFTNSWIHKI